MMPIEPRSIRAGLSFRTCAVLFVFLAALAGWGSLNAQSQKAPPPNCLGGTLDAPIRLEVFSDFQCGWCKAFYTETVTQILKNYSPADKVCVIYYEFPLETHPYGRKAAGYSLAAQHIGKKQWLAVVDALYTKQEKWSADGDIEAAIKGAVSAEDFELLKKNLQDPSIEEAIKRDIALGLKKGVTGTPSVFVTTLNKEQLKVQYLSYEVWKDYFNSIVK